MVSSFDGVKSVKEEKAVIILFFSLFTYMYGHGVLFDDLYHKTIERDKQINDTDEYYVYVTTQRIFHIIHQKSVLVFFLHLFHDLMK